jgi:ABC-2 type transport system ATP-binding protein
LDRVNPHRKNTCTKYGIGRFRCLHGGSTRVATVRYGLRRQLVRQVPTVRRVPLVLQWSAAGFGGDWGVKMSNAIETEGLGKDYRGVPAVGALSLKIARGEVFGLLGPNGAGKTTTIMMLLGNIRPTRGRALLLGRPIGDVAARRQVGFLPEKFQFHDFLTATEFLALHGKLAGMDGPALTRQVPAALERVGLADRAAARLRTFSKGMQQRIGLAQAILHSPDLVILDEPTSALDPMGRRDVRDIVTDLRARGCTVVLNSHLLSEIELTCDRIAIIHKGEVAGQGSIGELLAFSSTVAVEVRNLTDAGVAAVRAIAFKIRFDRVPITHFTAWVRGEDEIGEIARALVQSGATVLALVPGRETLEDLFVRTIEGKTAGERGAAPAAGNRQNPAP